MIVQNSKIKIFNGPDFGTEQWFAETDGCGCCSDSLSFRDKRDDIIENLKENICVAKEACEVLGIDFDEFVKETLDEC